MRIKKLSNNKKRKLAELINQAKTTSSNANHLETEQLCQKILQIDPNNADAFSILGVVAYQLQQLETAESLLKQACQLNPINTDCLNNLGYFYCDQENFQEALYYLQRSLDQNNKQDKTLFHKAYALKNIKQIDTSISSIQIALELQPKQASYHHLLGSLYLQNNQATLAYNSFQAAIQLDNHLPNVHLGLGECLLDLGKFQQAKEAFRESLKQLPKLTASYRGLAKINALNDQDIPTIQQLLTSNDLPKQDKIPLHFALAVYFERQKSYKQSFTQLELGNNLIRNGLSYNISHDHITFQQLKETFSHNFIEEKKKLQSGDTPLIFIIGMVRSGTSLAEQILASHPHVHGLGETDAMGNTFRAACQDENNYQNISHVLNKSDDYWQQLAHEYPKLLQNINTDSNIQLYTDKTPTNFLVLGLIHILYPNAKIIHCQRNAMDNCLSIYKENFAGSLHKYAYNLDEMGEFYLLYQDLMQHWHEVLPDGIIYNLQYETLVNNQQEETAKLLKHCGLDWHDDCLNFHQNKRAVATASATQVRKPMYKTSVAGWRRYEKQLTPLAKKLGYL